MASEIDLSHELDRSPSPKRILEDKDEYKINNRVISPDVA
jgi:hypothetical protein